MNKRVDPVLARFQDLVRPYWPAGREWVDNGYTTIPFPFEPIPTPTMELRIETDLFRFGGYLTTWSASMEYAKANLELPMSRFTEDFANAWGEPEEVHTVKWKFNIRAGRVS